VLSHVEHVDSELHVIVYCLPTSLMFNSKPSDINKGVLSEQRTLQAKSDGAELCAEFDILKIVWAGNNVQYLESQILAYMII
jgi:hypothetical protein